MKYLDYADSYLPGEVYRSGMREYSPQQRLDYKIAKKYNLFIIEDSAHALPTTFNLKHVGLSYSDACVFSFYANKTITTGEGGMVVTHNKNLANKRWPKMTWGEFFSYLFIIFFHVSLYFPKQNFFKFCMEGPSY